MENGIKIYKKIAQELSVINNPKADCTINLSKSTPNKIVIQCDFHHMNENGYYDGWSYHTVIITPCLGYDYDIKVTGRDKGEIKDYLGNLIYEAVDGEIVNKTEY